MDIDAVRAAAAVLICPVKIPGGGVYMGDMHALQGDGEIAGHTCDVAGTVTLQVHLIKGSPSTGPSCCPCRRTCRSWRRPSPKPNGERAAALAARWGVAEPEDSLPISVSARPRHELLGDRQRPAARRGPAGHGGPGGQEPGHRSAVRIEIGRAPGVVQVTFRAPTAALERVGLAELAREQYGRSRPCRSPSASG